MLNSKKTLTGIICTFLVLAVFLFTNGRYAPPDKLVLTVKYLGDRKVENTKKKSHSFLGKEVTANVGIGKRVPRDIPGSRRSFYFPLGTNSLTFTDSIIPESNVKEGFSLPVKGKQVRVDIVFNIEIMDDDKNIVTKLLKLLNKYQTVSAYSGHDGLILQELAKGIFRQELRQAFTQQTQGKNLKWVANNKTIVNINALNYLNKKFNEFGIRFLLASISSDVDLDITEQRKMNRLVYLAANNEVQEKRNRDLLPKKEQKVTIIQEGKTKASKLRSNAKVSAAKLVAEAELRQHTLLSSLLGADQAIQLKLLLTLYSGNSLKTDITIIPTGSKLLLGNTQNLAIGGIK